MLLTPGIGLGLTGDSVAVELALLAGNGEEEGDGEFLWRKDKIRLGEMLLGLWNIR